MSADPTNGQSNIDVILKAMAPDRREAFLRSRNRLKGLAQQRYVKSHRILANSRCVKDLRRFRNSQDGTWFSRSVLGA